MGEPKPTMARGEGDFSPASLCREVAEVIERVSRTIHPASEWEVSEGQELEEAERVLDAEAKRLRQGTGDPETWREALAAYESACFAALGVAVRADARYA